ncbi:MAG: tRNA uridine-5-carboxymethylaminomethyl(34) synthesis GTPase MnmE [Firmicutes bacterium]|nr:tRNA uridine-5-carboxymethylaminomethyl(34) synthesis GTPase MnmE [Bacillota bacterium]
MQKKPRTQTIVAIATPASAGAIGIIRLSGEDSLKIALKVFRAKGFERGKIEPRRMYLGEISAQNFKDKAFCVFFKSPESYTGEDMVEFHTHGGTSVLKGVLRLMCDIGARPATAGEFTKRAFLNGKMTLAVAEGIEDMINAESEAEAMQAYRLLSGELAGGIKDTISLLLEAVSTVDASLDYPEELLEDMREPVRQCLCEAKKNLEETLKSSLVNRHLKDGVTAVIAGLTNVGKSSLLNALLKEDRAIVTNIAGTTRDTLKEALEIGGVKINILDTAGIRNSTDEIEKEGIARAKKASQSADLVLFVTDLSAPETPEESAFFDSLKGKKIIKIGNKGDIKKYEKGEDIIVEARAGKNISALVELIKNALEVSKSGELVILTRERHIKLTEEALLNISLSLKNFNNLTADLLSSQIKTAHKLLSQITGTDASEEIVDKIFSSFCVGK